jgi:hypothetical protein
MFMPTLISISIAKAAQGVSFDEVLDFICILILLIIVFIYLNGFHSIENCYQLGWQATRNKQYRKTWDCAFYNLKLRKHFSCVSVSLTL